MLPLRGGDFKRAAMVLSSLALLAALVIAWRVAMRRQIDARRAWVVHACAIGLSLLTTRLYFIPACLIYCNPSQFEAAAVAWMGFLFNSAVAEWILRRSRRTRG